MGGLYRAILGRWVGCGDSYLDYNFFEHQIHWFSIFNSFMMVIFLCGLVSLILLRTLRNDYARFKATPFFMSADIMAEY